MFLVLVGSFNILTCTSIQPSKFWCITVQIQIQRRQAALAISGAYAHTTQVKLLNDLGLAPLNHCRSIAKLLLLFKIIRNLTPSYLKALIPKGPEPTYDKRHSTNLHLLIIKKNYFLKSFIPSSIRLWKELSQTLQTVKEIETFRTALKKIFTPDLLYKPYLYGHSKECVHLSRLRMGLSGLNSHRKTYHFIEYSTCPNCQHRNENTTHYLLQCPAYAAQRAEMIASLSHIFPNIQQHLDTIPKRKQLSNTLLYGTQNEVHDIKTFTIVAKFIEKTERFV